MLSWRTLPIRLGSALGIFVIVAMAATIAAAAGQIMATGLGAPGPGRFAATDAVVRADPTVTLGHGDDAETLDVQRSALLPTSALARVAAVPGVRSAVGDVAFPLTVMTRNGTPVPTTGDGPAHGHGWASAALTPYRLAHGHAPAGPGDIVLDAGLARAGGLDVGDRVRVVSPAGADVFRLSGIATATPAQQERQSSVFLTQARAQQLSGLGAGYNAIAIRTEPGVDQGQLRERVGAAAGTAHPQVLDHRHASAADAGDPRAFDRVELVAVIASGGGITLAIAIFVLAGTIGFAVERRRKEVALLRAIGATPGQARRLLLREAALLGLLGGVAGCIVATALSSVFTDALVSVGIAPDGFTVSPNWIPYGIAIGSGVVVALLATLVAAHRALSVRPGEALVEAAVPQRRLGITRTLLGLAALGGGITLLIVLSSQALSFATLSAFLFIIAVALLGPVVVGWPAALVGRALLPGGGAGFLAGSALASGRFRTGAVGAAIALVVALAGTQVVGNATAQRATERTTAARVHANRVLVARDGDGLPPSVAAAAATLRGATVAPMVSTEVYLLDPHLTNEGDGWDAAGLEPPTTPSPLDLDVSAGSLENLRGDGIAVSEALAKHDGVEVGRVLNARLADATPARLRVVAIYKRANGLGDVVLPRSLALAHATASLDSAVFVSASSKDRAAVAHGLKRIAHDTPTAVVASRASYLSEVRARNQENARAQWVVDALMIGIAVLAAFNIGAMAAAERRRELVLARLSGAMRRQVIGALTLESLVITAVGLAVGAAIVLASLVSADSDPTGGPLVIPWHQAALVLAGGAALGLLGTLIPAALVGRARLTALAGLRE